MDLSVNIKASVDGLIAGLKTAQNELRNVFTSAEKPAKITADTSQIESGLKGLQSEIKETAGLLSKMGGSDALSGLKKSFQEGREQASAGGGMFGQLANTIGQLASPVGAATAAVGALTAGLAATFEIGKEFETSLQSVSAVTGVSGAALDDIGNRAQGLAAKFGGSASEQLGVFQTALSKIGPQLAQDAPALSTFADNVNTLSKTDSALGAAGAVDALSGAMLQFGVNVNDSAEVARESTRFINVLAASAGVGSASVSDVAAAVANVGGTAKNANISFEELNAALQVQASKSIVGSAAGTGLTAVINKLQAASGPAADQLKTMGTSSEKLGQILTTKGIGAAMTELRGAMEKLGSTSEKNAFLVSLFGETGLNTAAALLGGGDMLAEFTTKVTGTSAATEQAAVNMNTLSEQMSRGKAAIENYAISAFKVLAPIVSQVFTAITKAFSIISETLAPIFSKLGDTLGGVFTRIGSILQPILALIGGYLISNIVVTLSAVGTALNVFFTLAVKVFDSLYTAIKPAVDAIKKAFGFSDDVKSTFDPLKTFQDILTFITEIIAKAGDYIATFGGYVIEFLLVPFRLVVAVLSPILGGLIEFGKNILGISGATQTAGGAVTYIKNAFEFLGKVINGIITTVKAVTAGIAVFAETATKVVDKILHLDFAGAVNTAKEGGKKIGTTVADTMNEGLKKIDSKAAADKVESDMKKAVENVQASINTLTLGKVFDELKAGADAAAKSALQQASGVQVQLDKLNAVRKGSAAEQKAALDEFVRVSGAANVTTYEQAVSVAKKALEDLQKTQKEKLIETQKLTAIEDGKDLVKKNKKAQDAAKIELDAEKNGLELLRQSREAYNNSLLQSDLERNIKAIQIKADYDIAVKESEIRLSKELAALQSSKILGQSGTDAANKEKENQKKLQNELAKIKSDAEQKQNEERAKTAVKQYEEEQKAVVEKLKLTTEFNKKTVELAEKRTVENTQQELDRQADLINAKLDAVQAGYNQELNDLLTKNASVAKADSALKNALSKGNLENVAKAKEALELARQDAITNDANILELRKKSNEEILKVEKESAASLQAFRISLIADDTERERQTRLLEAQKTLDAELLAARGNERLITEARQKAADARNEIEANAARKSQDINTRLIQGAKDLANGVSANIISSFAPLFDTFSALEKRFKTFADSISSDNKEANKKIEEDYKKNSAALLSQLKAREISWSDYQDKVAGLQRAGKDESSDVLGQVRKSFGEAFLAIGKDAQKNLDESFKKIAEKAKTSKFSLGSIWEDITTVATDAGASIASVLGTMAATGELTLKSAARATLGIAIDTAEKLLLANIPAIFATFASFLPPVVSQIAAGVAIAGMYGLLATAKAAIGGFHGGGYTGDGNEHDVAGVVHRKEGVLSHAALRGDVSAFHDLHNTLKSGESLSNILARYRREGESNSLVTPLGAIVTNSPATAFVAANNDTRIIAELRAQTAQLSQQLTEIKVGQKSAFKSNHNIGLDIAPSKFFDVIQTPRDIKRRSLQ